MKRPQAHAVFWLMLSLLLGWRLTTAQQPQPASDLQRLLAQNKLVVALVDIDYPPLFTASQNGHLEGSGIALVQDMARELGVQTEFVRKTHSFNEIIDIVSRGEADIGLATSITLPRAQKVLFTRPYMTLNMALLLNRIKLIENGFTSDIKSLSELRDTAGPIGLLTGSSYAVYTRQHFPQAALKEYATLTDLLNAVQRGEVLAAVRNDLTANLFLHRHPEAILRLQLFVDHSAKDYLAFPVRRDRPHLLAWLNAYLLIKDAHRNSVDVIEQYKQLRNGG